MPLLGRDWILLNLFRGILQLSGSLLHSQWQVLLASSSSSCVCLSLDLCPALSSPLPGSSSQSWPLSSFLETPSYQDSGLEPSWSSLVFSWMGCLANRRLRQFLRLEILSHLEEL